MLALDAQHEIVDCTFTGHQSLWSGTLYAYGRSMTVERCVFAGNRAGRLGGAIFNDWRSDMRVTETRFEDNTASIAGKEGNPNAAHYSAAKAGLESFTRAVAIEAARDGVRVNSLCLGMIATEQGDVAFDAEARAAMESIIPLGRFGKPREIANCALFLVSDQAPFVPGTTLIADGGQSASLGSPKLRTGHRQ